MSGSNCCFLTCIQISQEAGQVVWYSDLLKNFPTICCYHTVRGFGIVNKAEIDAFLELSCFFHDPADVGNLISGSSAFSKSSLNIWKFMLHILLKPRLENFENYFASVLNECNCMVVWTSSALPFFRIGMKTDLFQSCGHCWHIECTTFTASSFRIWNSSIGIPSPPLASVVCSCHLLFDHFQFALIHGPNIPGSYAILLFTASDLASITSHIHN